MEIPNTTMWVYREIILVREKPKAGVLCKVITNIVGILDASRSWHCLWGMPSLAVDDGVVQDHAWGGRDRGGCKAEGLSGGQNTGQLPLEQVDIHSKVVTEYQLGH